MKFSRELINGFLIFLGIGLYFILLEALGLSDVFWLRIFNAFIVMFGVNRTIKANVKDGLRGYNKNFLSGLITSLIGAALSIIGLLIYIEANGGIEYLRKLPDSFIFGGGKLSIYMYCIGLAFEAVAASLAVCFCLMQYWKDKVEVINRVN